MTRRILRRIPKYQTALRNLSSKVPLHFWYYHNAHCHT